MINSRIIRDLNIKLLLLPHSIFYKPDVYTKSHIYYNINMLLSEYASVNPYT